jgi:hypothetical protein
METLIPAMVMTFFTAVVFTASVLLLIWFWITNRKKPVKGPSKAEETKIILPLRLQAAERLILYLERITPQNLILRLNHPEMAATEFQTLLVKTIREEFEYNLSQQLYISAHSWELIKSAKEETISLINRAAGSLPQGAASAELIRMIFDLSMEKNRQAAENAIDILKKEVQLLFN